MKFLHHLFSSNNPPMEQRDLSIAFALIIAMMYVFRKTSHSRVNKMFGQIASSTFLSLTHGSGDGQKTMGVITALLIAGGLLHTKSFVIPIPVIIVAASAISLVLMLV